jgi:hypothetical protein
MSFTIRQNFIVVQSGYIKPQPTPTPDIDPYWQNVSTLLKGDQSPIIDSTGKNTFTVSGNTVTSSLTKKYGNGSIRFNGSPDQMSISSPSSDFSMGTGNFTWEFWFKSSQTSAYATIICKEWVVNPYTGGVTVFLNGATGRLEVWVADYSVNGYFLSANVGGHTNDAWHHFAWVRSGNTHKMYLDGNEVASNTYAGSVSTSTKQLTIGNDITWPPRHYIGYLDDLRITKGVARYTENFTPPDSMPTL